MTSFDRDEAMFELWQSGRVEAKEAVRYAESEHEVRMKIEFAQPGTFASPAAEELSLNDE